MSNTTRVRVEDQNRGFRQKIVARHHEWIADEPVEVAGTDTGPTPYEILLGALGACIAITVRMYANRKSWPLTAINIELSHHKEHATDCDDCEQTTGYVDVIEKQVTFSGDLSEEQIARLHEIAGKCPVHRTLSGTVQIR